MLEFYGVENRERRYEMTEGSPIFSTGDIETMSRTVDELMEATRVIARVARSLELSLQVAKQNLQRADQIVNPPYRDPVAPLSTRALTKGVIGDGAIRLLRTLQSTFPAPMQKALVAHHCKFAEGTMRTYIPPLRRGDYITESPQGIALTERGLALIASRPDSLPRVFLRQSNR